MAGKAFTAAYEANDNINHDNQYELTSTRMSTGLLDVNLVNIANRNKLHDKNRRISVLDRPPIWK